MKMTLKILSLVLVPGFSPACAQASDPVVAVDQAGYPTAARKVAIITARADSFHVVNAATRLTVYKGATGIASHGDAATGMELWNADFSSLRTPGQYVLFTSAGDSSQRFLVADSAYNQVYLTSLKSFYYQRCGTTLPPAYAGAFVRSEACHLADGTFHPTAEGTGRADVTGGWHDAGDFGKYVVNAGITTGTLLAAYEWFPAKFAADNLNIPESGNSVPDILDEVRYELQWFLKMQRSDGSVFSKVARERFEDFVKPESDSGVRYIYQTSSTATANFVAVMARAAREFLPFDSAFAAACLSSAAKGWQYLQAKPSIVPAGGFKNPSGTITGEYGDRNDRDERLWAAAELYLANGNTSAHAYFRDNYEADGIMSSTMTWSDVRPLGQLTYLRGTRAGIDTQVQKRIRRGLVNYCETIRRLHDESGFGAALSVSDFIWGSNSQALNNAVLLIVGAEEGRDPAFLQAASDQLHYVLGVNAHGQSFVTGIGGKRTMHPHHRPSAADGIVEPVPGLLSGGPNRNVNQDPVLTANFSRATPPALCYKDDEGSWASNETAINWNAALVFVAGCFHTHQ